MAHIIEDGTGKGYLAKVNSSNRLEVESVRNDLHTISQQEGRAFSCYIKRDISVSNTEEPLGVITYDGAGRLAFSEMTFSLSVTDASAVQFARIEVHVDPTGVSGGTTRIPLNLNRASNKQSDTVVVSGDTAITASFAGVTSEIYHTQLSCHGTCAFTWTPQDAFLLEKGDSIIITAKGLSTTGNLPGVRCTIRWYEEDLETL